MLAPTLAVFTLSPDDEDDDDGDVSLCAPTRLCQVARKILIVADTTTAATTTTAAVALDTSRVKQGKNGIRRRSIAPPPTTCMLVVRA